MRRASSAQDKERRRTAILRAAGDLLDGSRYEAVSMAAVAREAGIAKGTTYLYFPTKEQLFLALLEDEYAAWFGAARIALRELGPTPSPEQVTAGLMGTLRDRPRLLSLMERVHRVLEQNISVDAAGAFKGRLQDEATGLALVLSEKAGISMRRAMRLLLQLHVLVVGIRQIARPPAAVATALERPGLAGMRVDFDLELRAALRSLLREAMP